MELQVPSLSVHGVLPQYSSMNVEINGYHRSTEYKGMNNKSGEIQWSTSVPEEIEVDEKLEILSPLPPDTNSIDLPKELYIAVEMNDEEKVDCLLEQGADLSFTDQFNQTAFHLACGLGYESMARKMYSTFQITSFPGVSTTPLHRASMGHHLPLVEWLLSISNHDIDLQDDGGFTALHWACENVEIGKILFLSGSSPLIPDADGNTPLHLFASYGHSTFVLEMATQADDSLLIENRDGIKVQDLLSPAYMGNIFCQVPNSSCIIQ